MNSDKKLMGEIAFECLILRDTQKVLHSYESARKANGSKILYSTKSFWQIALLALLNSIAIKVHTLMGPASVNDHEQVSFEALYRRMGDDELKRFPLKEFSDMKNRHREIIKEWKKYRHNFAAHKKLRNSEVLEEVNLNIKKSEELITDMHLLATKLWSGLFDTGFPQSTLEGNDGPHKDLEQLLIFASQGLQNHQALQIRGAQEK